MRQSSLQRRRSVSCRCSRSTELFSARVTPSIVSSPNASVRTSGHQRLVAKRRSMYVINRLCQVPRHMYIRHQSSLPSASVHTCTSSIVPAKRPGTYVINRLCQAPRYVRHQSSLPISAPGTYMYVTPSIVSSSSASVGKLAEVADSDPTLVTCLCRSLRR